MSRLCWIIGVLFATQETGAAGVVMTVQVYNAVSATESEIHKALGGAGRILRQAGVEAHWVDCGSKLRDPMGIPACVQRIEPGLFVLSILPEDPRGGGNALGFAVLAGRRNGTAVIYPRVVSILKDNPQYADCNLLASVIAHELGHLLLRSPQHGEGIMKANWDASDFKAMQQNRLRFSRAQSQGFGAGLFWRGGDTSFSSDGSKKTVEERHWFDSFVRVSDGPARGKCVDQHRPKPRRNRGNRRGRARQRNYFHGIYGNRSSKIL